MHQVLKLIFQGGSDSEWESMEDETESEHEHFCSMLFQMTERKVYNLKTPGWHWHQDLRCKYWLRQPISVSLMEILITNYESGISNKDDGELWTWQLLAVHSV